MQQLLPALCTPPTLKYEPGLIVADGEFVIVHGRFSGHGGPKNWIAADVGGLTTQDGQRVFPNAEVYVAKAESDFWLSPEIAAKAPKDAQPFFQSAKAIATPYIKAGKWHTLSGHNLALL